MMMLLVCCSVPSWPLEKARQRRVAHYILKASGAWWQRRPHRCDSNPRAIRPGPPSTTTKPRVQVQAWLYRGSDLPDRQHGGQMQPGPGGGCLWLGQKSFTPSGSRIHCYINSALWVQSWVGTVCWAPQTRSYKAPPGLTIHFIVVELEAGETGNWSEVRLNLNPLLSDSNPAISPAPESCLPDK